MAMFIDDEKTVYRIIGFEALCLAWKEYNRSVDGIVVVLREHHLSDAEIQQMIEESRK